MQSLLMGLNVSSANGVDHNYFYPGMAVNWFTLLEGQNDL